MLPGRPTYLHWKTHKTQENFGDSQNQCLMDPSTHSPPPCHLSTPVHQFPKMKKKRTCSSTKTACQQTRTTYADNINEAMLSLDPHPLNSKFTKSEIMRCVKNLPSKTIGLDRVHIKMICPLSDNNLNTLLHLVNVMFAAGYVPPSWKNAVIAPILKTKKPPTETGSYRPIALTSCLGKVMEKMINNRLKWHSEKHQYLPMSQTVFRKGCTTMDNVIRLETSVKIAFNSNRVTTAVFLDLSKAYDITWTNGLLYK